MAESSPVTLQSVGCPWSFYTTAAEGSAPLCVKDEVTEFTARF